MKKLIALLLSGMLVACFQGGAAAQELLVAPSEAQMQGLTPDLALPPAVEDLSIAEPQNQEFWEGETEGSYESSLGELYQCDQAVLESTGSWLRRGFWYAETDAVVLNRTKATVPVILAQQTVGIGTTVIGTQFPIINGLRIDERKPVTEGAPRFTLGRFLFRDHKNRDHVAEFSIFGGGEWTRQGSLSANPDNDLGTTSLEVPSETDQGNLSFDTAQNSNYRYDSRLNNFELNYLVKERMGHDRMEMEPSGRWVRRAGASYSRTFLAGVRFMDLTENLLWNASGIENDDTVDDDIGFLGVRTDNDMIGTQLGVGLAYERARWSAGLNVKGGLFLNIADMNSRFSLTRNLSGDDLFYQSALEDEKLSYVIDTALVTKWHLRPNFSLRASAELMLASSQAYADNQFAAGVFVPGGANRVIIEDDLASYMGGSIGFEGYW